MTTDYIYRGYSETGDKGAIQLDLHAGTLGGTFVGVWASTLDRKFAPWADSSVQEYIGQRFNLGSDWNTSLTAANYSYLGGDQRYSSDYQQLALAFAYLDRWNVSLTAIPNQLRYGYSRYYYPSGRHPAYDAETSGQWLIANGVYVTGGAGYFLITGDGSAVDEPTSGYLYGNAGLAYEWRGLRIDIGYFLTQEKALRLLPYRIANHRFAGTLSWHF